LIVDLCDPFVANNHAQHAQFPAPYSVFEAHHKTNWNIHAPNQEDLACASHHSSSTKHKPRFPYKQNHKSYDHALGNEADNEHSEGEDNDNNEDNNNNKDVSVKERAHHNS
jgi:hypothetical protein